MIEWKGQEHLYFTASGEILGVVQNGLKWNEFAKNVANEKCSFENIQI